MFRFTREPSSGSQSQFLAKITGMVPLCFSICALSVVHRAGRYWSLPSCTVNQTHAQQVGTCRQITDKAHIDKHSGTVPVISARH